MNSQPQRALARPFHSETFVPHQSTADNRPLSMSSWSAQVSRDFGAERNLHARQNQNQNQNPVQTQTGPYHSQSAQFPLRKIQSAYSSTVDSYLASSSSANSPSMERQRSVRFYPHVDVYPPNETQHRVIGHEFSSHSANVIYVQRSEPKQQQQQQQQQQPITTPRQSQAIPQPQMITPRQIQQTKQPIQNTPANLIAPSSPLPSWVVQTRAKPEEIPPDDTTVTIRTATPTSSSSSSSSPSHRQAPKQATIIADDDATPVPPFVMEFKPTPVSFGATVNREETMQKTETSSAQATVAYTLPKQMLMVVVSTLSDFEMKKSTTYDLFVKIEHAGKVQSTSIRYNAKPPVFFNETFMFEYGAGPIHVSLCNATPMAKHPTIGWSRLSIYDHGTRLCSIFNDKPKRRGCISVLVQNVSVPMNEQSQ